MGSNRPVKQADNLPATPLPVIKKTPPTTIKVPAPPFTPTPPKKPAK